jgi:sec-independent protein translocase protein TatC
MPSEKDLFTEEQTMVTMSFGDHLEELRARLILALMGLVVGVIIAFVPPFFIGRQVQLKMQEPASAALKEFYEADAARRIEKAKQASEQTPPVRYDLDAADFLRQVRDLAPDAKFPDPATIEGKTIQLTMTAPKAEMIRVVAGSETVPSSVITLGPLEGITILLMVGTITGLVIVSPWVFYQAWAFVAAGLYRHERHYVVKFLPISIGLFLAGVFLCFFAVLPVTLHFLLAINVWLDIEPTLRLSEWMGFATILPLVFGLCFQTPLVMLFIERVGLMSADDFRAKRKFAILIMVIVAAVLTPGPDVFSQCMLAVPMIALYELGILLMGRNKSKAKANTPATT